MFKKILVLSIFFNSAITIGQTISPKDFCRLQECIRMKNLVGSQFWPELQRFKGPWVYITDSGQFLVNSNVVEGFKEVDISDFQKNEYNPTSIQWRSVKDKDLAGDSYSYEANPAVNFVSPSKDDVHYKNPIVYTTSYEVFKKNVPLVDTENWSSIFMHEAFHQYQLSQTTFFQIFLDLYKKNLLSSSGELADIFKENKWYSDSLREENRLILDAFHSPAKAHRDERLKQFFAKRKDRRVRAKKELSKDVEKAELFWETLEGGARFYEAASFRIMKDAPVNKDLAKHDPSYGSYKNYRKGYSFDKMLSLDTDSTRTRYVYTTGFAMYLLLEKYDQDFSKNFFESRDIFVEDKIRKLL